MAAANFSFQICDFAKSLVPEDRVLYEQQLQRLKCHDPYLIPLQLYKSSRKSVKTLLPKIEKQHLTFYFVLERDLSDGERHEAYKNLDSEQYLINTFTDKLLLFPLTNGVVIIRTHVTHSQSLSEKAAKPWAAIRDDGKVIIAFCDCKAGLSTVCIHVSALLQLAVSRSKESTYEDVSTNMDEDSVPITSRPCTWNKPGNGPVTIGKIADLKVQSRRKRNISVDAVPRVTDEEYGLTNERLSNLPKLSTVLSCVTQYADKFLPPQEMYALPSPFSDLYDPLFECQSVQDQNEECERLISIIKISKEDQNNVDLATRGQSVVEEWNEQRSGRITGTKIHRICKRDVSKELSSGEINFLLEICYPELIKFTGNKSTRYGLKTEPLAVKFLEQVIKERNEHESFICEEVGLIISTATPYLAASPDRISSCTCHGKSVVEIKCPFTLRDKSIREHASSPNSKGFCLLLDKVTNKLIMDPNHEYYYQIQLQLYVTELSRALFVVYNGYTEIEYVVVERDHDLIDDIVGKSKLFFLNFILPELLCKRFSSVKKLPAPIINSQNPPILRDQLNQFICYCQDPNRIDKTVTCSSSFCVIHEFHISCTRSKKFKDWLCLYCKKEVASKRRKAKKQSDFQNNPASRALSVTDGSDVPCNQFDVGESPAPNVIHPSIESEHEDDIESPSVCPSIELPKASSSINNPQLVPMNPSKRPRGRPKKVIDDGGDAAGKTVQFNKAASPVDVEVSKENTGQKRTPNHQRGRPKISDRHSQSQNQNALSKCNDVAIPVVNTVSNVSRAGRVRKPLGRLNK